MSIWTLLFGKPIPTHREDAERVGVSSGIAVLGLDALASAAYGPEAALAVFLAAHASGLGHIVPLLATVVVVLFLVQLSYRQVITATPSGGGSYTVAKKNLGTNAGLLAAAALFLDYILNAAVAISAGVGALVSAFPALLPHTLGLALGILVFLTLVNLRGVRSAGLVFTAPTWLYVIALGGVIVAGVVRMLGSGGSPQPVTPPASVPLGTTAAISTWLVVRAFSSGCTAMTGVEAVSNGVPIFKKPSVNHARDALSAITLILAGLLLGVAVLSRAYGITATPPGQAGYQSVLSQVTAAVVGRGLLYYVTIGAIVVVLCLSANTSFAGFPRLCRVLALDQFLPDEFAHQGRRLVYSLGVIVLATIAAVLLIVFKGLTDHLIPLFAVGAFSAFTLAQFGMVVHWHRGRGPGWRHRLVLNVVGGTATAGTLVVIILTKFSHGAWISLTLMATFVLLFRKVHAHLRDVEIDTELQGPMEVTPAKEPIVLVPMKRLDKVGRKALEFAMSISNDVRVVQIRTQREEVQDLAKVWHQLVVIPAHRSGMRPPQLLVRASRYRKLIDPLLGVVGELRREHPDRFIAVMVPELVERRWYHFLFHSHTATLLKFALLFRGGPRVVLINTPWYVQTRADAPPLTKPATA